MMVTRLCKSVMSRAFFLIFTISNNAWGKCSVNFNQFNGLLLVMYVAVGGGSFFFKMQSWQAKTIIKKANHNKGGGVENTYFYFYFNVNYPTITFFIFSKKSGRGRSSFKIQFFIGKIIRKLPVAREKFAPPPPMLYVHVRTCTCPQCMINAYTYTLRWWTSAIIVNKLFL